MEIKSRLESSIDDIDTVCVAVARPNKDLKQQHIGFFYFDGDMVNFLHLAKHNKLVNESPDDKYLWLDISLDPINKIHFATYCATVYEQNKMGIPYGFDLDGTDFSEDGHFLKKNQYMGLTCGSFVVQVFRAQGYEIIDLNNWPSRQEDKTWQELILSILRKYVSMEYFNYQDDKIKEGIARFKPEEVAVAATLPNPPYGLDEIKKEVAVLFNKIVVNSRIG